MDIPPVVDMHWCDTHIDEIVWADVRWSLAEGAEAGRRAYEEGHVPGAVFVDLDADLAAPPDPHEGRHPLPSPAEFARSMSGLGVGDTDMVVAYDDSGGAWAARLVWMLRVTGRAAALFDGGIAAWTGELSRDTPVRPPGDFSARPWPVAHTASLGQVRGRGDEVTLVDVRSPDRYSGATEPVDPRAGHVPGARNLPWSGNIDDRGRFLSAAELRSRYEEVGATDASTTIVHCGSGVTACHGALSMERAGLGLPRVWIGSWSQWASDADLPSATGSVP